MQSGGVLVFGYVDGSANGGLKADEKAVTALDVPVTAASTGSATRNEEGNIETIEAAPIDDATGSIDCKVVKIGALFSTESIKFVSGILKDRQQLSSVIDAEPFFKTGPAPTAELVTALTKDVLPSITILFATVPEVKKLLDEAGIPADYPKNMDDVVSLANTLRKLGPKYVIIKREILEEGDGTTTLHFILCGGAEPQVVASRFENPKRLFGISYSIPPLVAAYLAKGTGVPEAVSAGFKFAEEMLKGGQYYI
ncbi:Ribokinase-like protein [Thozetella sp. PMI_491]|nr:Ribokinase-like protein [Thozetella sp. PMI_491]